MAVKNFTKRKQSSKRKTRKQIKHRKQQGGDLKNMINSSKKTLLKMESELRSLNSALEIIQDNDQGQKSQGKAWHPDGKIVTSDDVEAVENDIQLKTNQILEVKKKIGEINSSYGSVSEIKNY